MRKPKVACFHYKRYDDIYVSNVVFSLDVLLSMLDAFPDQKIIVLIESDENNIQILSSIGKSKHRNSRDSVPFSRAKIFGSLQQNGVALFVQPS